MPAGPEISKETLLSTLCQAHEMLTAEDYGRPVYGQDARLALALGRLERAMNAISKYAVETSDHHLAAQSLAELIDEELDPLTITNTHVLDWYLRLASTRQITIPLLHHFKALAPCDQQFSICQFLIEKYRYESRSLSTPVIQEIDRILCNILSSKHAEFYTGPLNRIIQSQYFDPNGVFLPFLLNYVRANPSSDISTKLLPGLVSVMPLPPKISEEIWIGATVEVKNKLLSGFLNRKDILASFRCLLAEYVLINRSHSPEDVNTILSSAERPGLKNNIDFFTRLINATSRLKNTHAAISIIKTQNSPTLTSAWLLFSITDIIQPSPLEFIEVLDLAQKRSWPIPKPVLANLLLHQEKSVRLAAIAASNTSPAKKRR